MKKIIKLIAMVIMLLSGTNAFAASKKSIVCVTYPEYDWVMNILGEQTAAFDVILLQNNGTDLHSYQPSVKDIARISSSDLFIYVGGESEKWVEKVISNSRNKNQIVVNMMEALGDKVREEEIVEGMQAEENDEESEDEAEYDEHIWLSLKNAIVLTNIISEKIQRLDSANNQFYKKNTENYVSQLSALDEEYIKTISTSNKKTILFGDRYPFRYLSDDYDMKYYAAFLGCSAESEASFETIVFLAKKVDDLDLDAVLTIEKSDKKIAKTIVANTKSKNQQILELDSMQSITQNDIKNGRTYLSAMKNNLQVLKASLK